MLIYSFDCGTINLGVCIVEYDKDYINKLTLELDKIKKYINNLVLYTNVINNPSAKDAKDIRLILLDFLSVAKNINKLLDSVFTIKYIDLINLFPGQKLKDIQKTKQLKYCEILASRRLKFLLNQLSSFGQPDTVLIENQFVSSSMSCIIAHQINYHYAAEDSNISHANSLFNILDINKCAKNKIDISSVQIVGASLKNSIDYDKKNSYSNNIIKYSNNYTANKNHSLQQFKYLIDIFNQNHIIEKFNSKKLFDISDAYLMARNYILLKKKNTQ